MRSHLSRLAGRAGSFLAATTAAPAFARPPLFVNSAVRPSAASARFFSSAKQVLSIATVFESAASAAASARLPVSHTVSSLPDVTFASMHAHRVAGDDAASAEGSSVTVSGWVRTCRGQKNDVFLVLNDGTNVAGMQVICSTDLLSADVVAASRALTAGASVTVSGRLARNERQPLDSAEAYEVHATALTVWSVCPANAAAAAEQVGVPIEAVSAAVDADAAAAAAAAEAKHAKKTKKKQKGPDGAAADPGVAPSAAVAAEPLEVSCELPVTPYPLQKKVQSISFLRDHPHLRMRTNTYAAVFRVRSEASYQIHSHFRSAGFSQVHAPTITPLDCEGAGELFTLTTPTAGHAHADAIAAATAATAATVVGAAFTPSSSAVPTELRPEDDAAAGPAAAPAPAAAAAASATSFFGVPAHMSVSGQLYGEIAAASVKKVYSFGPTYRAEPSQTSRHLAEFWMLEPEVAFTDLAGVCTLCEASIQGVTRALLSSCAADIAFLQERYEPGLRAKLELVASAPFARMTYTDALAVLTEAQNLGKVAFTFPLAWGLSLQAEHERYLAEHHIGGPLFVTNYPAAIKPFYMRVDDAPAAPAPGVAVATPEDLRTVACVDLLVPGMGELCGGSQREERYHVLLQRMHESGMKTADYTWYADLRRFGSVPHAGWGMGFERFVAFATGMENVRDTTLVPRAAGLMQL